MGLTDALGPQLRAERWGTKARERSLRTLVRHVQALAARWMQAILPSELALRRGLTHACHTAERMVAKAVSTRPTTLQRLREHWRTHQDSITWAEAVNA